ncbi:MAG: hypothetical protein JJE13_00310 [Thermoleophilia bacterium]|nr:hypothetical protein [Thermoleophilia bacterium]
MLLDIDGVLHVGDEPIPGAVEACRQLRSEVGAIRLVTNTSSVSRQTVIDRVIGFGFEVEPEEVLTPAAMAVRYCRSKGYEKVNLLVAKSLRADLEEIDVVGTDEQADAIVLGDLGSMFNAQTLNFAFRQLLNGAAKAAGRRAGGRRRRRGRSARSDGARSTGSDCVGSGRCWSPGHRTRRCRPPGQGRRSQPAG